MHFKLLETVPQQGKQRNQIIDFIRSLRERPDTPGDFTDKDSSGRECQVKIVGAYAITYWLDDPVHVVMVVDVAPADKRT